MLDFYHLLGLFLVRRAKTRYVALSSNYLFTIGILQSQLRQAATYVYKCQLHDALNIFPFLTD